MHAPSPPTPARSPLAAAAAPLTGQMTGRYPYYVLFMLGLVNMMNYVDRNILSVLIRAVLGR